MERQIVQAGRKGQTDKALELYQSLVQQQLELKNNNSKILTLRHLNAAIDACGRARPVRLDQAVQLLEQATGTGIGTKNLGLVPNEYTLGALVSACARASNADAAVHWLQQLPKQFPASVKPNAVCYQAAMTACARQAKLQQALQLLEQAKAQNIPLTVIAYNVVLSAAANAGNIDCALDLFRTMDVPKDAVTYGTLLAALEAAQEWELLLEYAETMPPLDGLALMSVFHACQQLGLPSKACDVLEDMKALSSNSSTDKSTSSNQPHRQHWQTQRSTAGWYVAGQRPPLMGPDQVAYQLAISACARGGAWQEGLRLLAELEQVSAMKDNNDNNVNSNDMPSSTTTTRPTVMAYTAAITGCEYAGRWKEALQILERMRHKHVQPNQVTFAAVLGACATACARHYSEQQQQGVDASLSKTTTMLAPQEKALRLLRVMKKDPSIPNPNTQVYNAAIRTCAEALDFPRALKVYQDMLDYAEQLDTEEERQTVQPNVITYGTLMTACERVGSMEGVSQVLKLVQQDENVPNANHVIYGAAISACRKAKQDERAFLLFQKLLQLDLPVNIATYNTVLKAQTEALSKYSKSTNSNPALDRAMRVYQTLVTRHQTHMDSIANTNSTSTASTKTIRVAQPNRQTYSILIPALATQQQPRQAETLLHRMRRTHGLVPDVNLYTATVTAYEKLGQPLKALRLMESMRADGYDFYEAPVLNAAFKRAVKLVSVMGRGLQQPQASSTTTLLEDSNDTGLSLGGNAMNGTTTTPPL